ncbi:MAG: C25 family peptidase propeptide domain-containing protein, partial [Caldilinea sp.]
MKHHHSFHRQLQRFSFAAVIFALLLSQVIAPLPLRAAPANAPAATPAAALSIVDVSAPDINCIFDVDCTITVNDLADHFTPPVATGDAFLQSRTWPVGEAGTPGAGLYAYLYRVDLRNAVGVTAAACVTSMTIDFGPVVPLDYDGDKTPDDLFVVVKGGIGNVRPAAADLTGDTLTLRFDPAVCVGGGAGSGDSSFFFGLASTQPPQDVTARLQGTLGLNETLDARAPKRADAALSGRFAYVHAADTSETIIADYKGFLESKGFSVTPVALTDVLATDFGRFDLTLIGDDTGYLGDWGSAPGQAEHIAGRSKVLGIGEGGYAFFGELGLRIGWPNGWHGSQDSVVGDASLSFYQTPNNLTGLLGAPLKLYAPPTNEVGIHLPEPVAGVTVLGTEPGSSTHHPLIAQRCHQLWGFDGYPQAMTEEGRALFINAVVFGLEQCSGRPQVCTQLTDHREIPAPALIDFDDLPDASVIGDHYAGSHGLHFYAGADTRVITYADREADPTKARSTPNVASNDAVSPNTSAGVPMSFWFDQPKTHVGFWMGNGEEQGHIGTLVAYDATGRVICTVRAPVPEPYQRFLGIHDPAGRIVRLTLDYGDTLLSESIDDLYFAPHASDENFPLPEEPPFETTEPISITVGASNNKSFAARFGLPEAQLLNVKGPDGIDYVQHILPGVDVYGNAPGLPDVPVVRRMLAVPRGATVKLAGLRVIPGEEYTVDLWPTQASAADATLQQEEGELPPETFVDPPFTKDADAYNTDANFPREIVSIEPMGSMRDLDLVQLNIAGGQYNPKRKLLTIFQSVEFEVIFEGGEGAFLPRQMVANPFERSFDGIYAQVLNNAAIFQHLGEIVAPPSCWGHEYLIITHPTFRPAADALRNWKVSRGLSTVVIETGNGAGQAGTTAAAIRNTVLSRYNNCIVRPSYLLLLG